MSETKKVPYAGIGLYGYDTTTKAKPIPFPAGGGEGMDSEEVQEQIDKSIKDLPTDEEVQEKIDEAIEQLPPDKYLKSVAYDSANHAMVYVFVTEEGESTVSVPIETGQELALSAMDEADDAKSVAESAQEVAESAQSVADEAKNVAESAQTAAESAQEKAESAQTVADSSKEIAESALTVANEAKETADSAKTTAENAQEAVQSAQTVADEAKSAAESAQTVAAEAKTTAEDAQAVAQSAQTTAEEAKNTADSAKTIADEAKAQALTAESKADDAKAAAESAQTAANEASSKADAADAKADEAKTAAQTADSKAVEAGEVAASAGTKAEEAISKAEEAKTGAELAYTKAEEAKAAVDAADEVISGIQSTIEVLSDGINSAMTLAGEAKSDAEGADVKAEEAKTAANEAEIKAVSALTEIEVVNSTLETINSSLEGLATDLSSANTEISDLKATFEEHDAECEAEIANLSGMIADEAAARETFDAEIGPKVENALLDINSVSAMATANETNIARNNGRINVLENDEILISGDLQTTISSLQEQIFELLELKKAISQASATNGIKVTYHADTYAELEDALKVNGIVKLEADIDENKRIVPSTLSSNNTTLNLNGKNLTLGVMDGGSGGYGIITRGSMVMTVQGTGVVENRNTAATESYNYEIFKVDGSSTLNLNGGTYKTNTDQPIAVLNTTGCTCNISGANTTLIAGTSPGAGSECIFVDNGTLNIYNGKFRVDGVAEPQFLLNCRDTNYRAGTAKINVYGGKFYGFNPANNTAEGPDTSFIPEGYTATVTESQETIDGVTYTVYTVKTTKNAE